VSKRQHYGPVKGNIQQIAKTRVLTTHPFLIINLKVTSNSEMIFKDRLGSIRIGPWSEIDQFLSAGIDRQLYQDKLTLGREGTEDPPSVAGCRTNRALQAFGWVTAKPLMSLVATPRL
jgi:hypothetical protein